MREPRLKALLRTLIASAASAGALHLSTRVPAGDLRELLEVVAALWAAVLFGTFWKTET